MADYSDHIKFAKRASWLFKLGYKHITIIGCAYGFTIKHLVETFEFTNVVGIDKSQWAVSKAHELGLQDYVIQTDILLHDFTNTELIISWSVLDTLSSDDEALSIANYLNLFKKTQIHVISMSGDNYKEWGYYIRSYDYWRSLFPDAYLVCWECKKVYTPEGKEPIEVLLKQGRVAI
jgi:predicted TPR repeat methyltransferase